MKNNLKLFTLALMMSGLIFATSCSKDDDETPATNVIVGTWTYQSADFDITVNNQPFRTYLIQVLGLDQLTAIFFESVLVQEFEDDTLTGSTITFNADGTYSAKDGEGVTTNGTYTLNANKTQLTMTEGSETYTVNVKELTANRFIIEIEEEEMEDFDEDGTNETIKIKVTATFTK